MDTKAKFVTQGQSQEDNLIAGSAAKLVARKIIIATGEGDLPRGAVLGKVTAANSATTPTGDAGNDGAVTFSAITVADTALDGNYSVLVTAAIDGATAAKFKVTGPTGKTSTGSMGTAFSGQGLGFTITDGLTTNASAVGDVYTFAVVASKDQYRLSLSASNDGSQTPDIVLAESVAATTADAEAIGYSEGEFAIQALTIGAGHTAASITEGLRAKGITLVNIID